MPPKNFLVIALTIVFSLACYGVAAKNRYANLFAEAMEVVETRALIEVPREKLFESAMKGMLTDHDKHSMFISGEQLRAFDEDIKQEFGGVGMYVDTNPETKQLFVLAPMPGTPAFAADFRPGDRIVEIDGKPTQGKKREDAITWLRGPIGGPVEMVLERGEENTQLKKTIRRAMIPVDSVHGDYRNLDGTWNFVMQSDPQIGYIRILQFGERTDDEVSAALQTIDGKIDSLIIDLRNNSGGLLDAAIDICDMFLPAKMPIVRTQGRDSQEQHYSSSSVKLAPETPIVVLVNRESASASEVVAGCLQDHARAIVVGEQSWGKGTVQILFPIQKGKSLLKLTTASYWRPSGIQIDRYDPMAQSSGVWGIRPNPGYAVEQTQEDVFANILLRNARDIEGLLSPEQSSMVRKMRGPQTVAAFKARSEQDQGEQTDDSSDRPIEDRPSEDVESPGTADDGTTPDQVPAVDRPLKRAIEHLQSLRQSNRIAA